MDESEWLSDEEVRAVVAQGKAYTTVLLQAGPARLEGAERQAVIWRHLRCLLALRARGVLLVNGPFTDEGEPAAVSIYAGTDAEQVRAWVEADPAVAAGIFTFRIRSWFGIAGDSLK